MPNLGISGRQSTRRGPQRTVRCGTAAGAKDASCTLVEALRSSASFNRQTKPAKLSGVWIDGPSHAPQSSTSICATRVVDNKTEAIRPFDASPKSYLRATVKRWRAFG